MYYEKWRALGSEAAIFLADVDESLGKRYAERIKNYLGAFEERFSRFKNDSELSRLNAAAGSEFAVSSEMLEILLAARRLYEETNGIFDPLILPQLECVGYEKSFTDNMENEPKSFRDQGVLGERHYFNEVLVDEARGSVWLPAGAKIDLGGIGKGYVADQIAADLTQASLKNFWISLGGDLRFSGMNGDLPWKVGVQNPQNHDQDLFELTIGSEFSAVATSGTTKRRFAAQHGRGFNHHIIDPRTGLSAASGIVAATVIADSAVRADVLAKTALILGARTGVELINKLPNAKCVLIDDRNNPYFSKGMRAFIQPLQ